MGDVGKECTSKPHLQQLVKEQLQSSKSAEYMHVVLFISIITKCISIIIIIAAIIIVFISIIIIVVATHTVYNEVFTVCSSIFHRSSHGPCPYISRTFLSILALPSIS